MSSNSSASVIIASSAAFLAGAASAFALNVFNQEDKSSSLIEKAKCIYEVDASFPIEYKLESEQWLRGHIKEMVRLPGFLGATFSKRENLEKPTVIFVLGGPGAGKGTQCAKIVEEFGYEHISAGDCLREERNSGSEYATLINNCIKEGQIVPVEITVKMLQKAMKKSTKNKFLIDGFPRNANNMDGWNEIIGDSVNVEFVLFLDCPLKVMESRLLERGKSSGRNDDNPESIKKRFDTYQQQTQPIIQHFESLNKVRKVIADNTIENVFEEVKKVLLPLEQPELATWTVQYHMVDEEAYKEYINVYAPEMRKEALSLGYKIQTTRRLLSKRDVVNSPNF